MLDCRQVNNQEKKVKIENKHKIKFRLVYIPDDLHHEYKVYCANRNLKMNEVIPHVLESWIAEWRLK